MAEKLARHLYQTKPAFVQLKGPVGAGKTTFARAFISTWLALEEQPQPETIASPTYNLVKTYGQSHVAHFDLYRMESLDELEQLGFEMYFYEFPCCVVEWLEQVPGAEALAPKNKVLVELLFAADPNSRKAQIEGLLEAF